jgi:hypothetical protein
MTDLARHLSFLRLCGRNFLTGSNEERQDYSGEELLATFTSAAGIILAVTENRNWIEVFFDGVIMHTETVNLQAGKLFSIYVEEIAHKSTVYEHPRTMIYFDGPYDLRVTRDGDRVIVTGIPNPRGSAA